MNDEQIDIEIFRIEEQIRMRARHTHFGDSIFSGWYEEQVKKISALRKQ